MKGVGRMDGKTELLRSLGLEGVWHNFVFLGEAGSGKSEIAISFAKALAKAGDKPVHFFDLDMTKPRALENLDVSWFSRACSWFP